MKKRIDVDYAGGHNTIVYSVRENKFYAYEQDREELHRLYGGKQYYWSQSGLSGAGFLEIESSKNDLVRFGYYRTDARSQQKIETVHTTSDGLEIFGYIPIVSHVGIDSGKPVVLTDGVKVALISQYDVKEALLKWQEIEGKKITINYFNQYGCEREQSFMLYNPNHYKGVRVTRFLDLRDAREAVKKAETFQDGLFQEKLRIHEHQEEKKWFHLSKDGFFDQIWNENPREIVGEITGGWQGAGDGLFWRRRQSDVEAFAEVERSKYVVPEEKYLDFEQNFSVLEWFSRTIEEWKGYFVGQLIK